MYTHTHKVGQKQVYSFFVWKILQFINKNIRTNSVSHSHNFKATFAHIYTYTLTHTRAIQLLSKDHTSKNTNSLQPHKVHPSVTSNVNHLITWES